MNELVIRQPDDWHIHLRDDDALKVTVPHVAAQFGRAIVMPNLRPPITTVDAAAAYRERILAARPVGSNFEPLMTLYLTDTTSPEEIAKAKAAGFVKGVKLYPAGATTNSDAGVTAIEKTYPALAEMAAQGIPLLVHGEVTDSTIDLFDREAAFIEQVLKPLLNKFPDLRVVFEHITTADAAAFVRSAGERVGATMTAHHLLYNRNAIFQGGVRPHYYCLPVLKREWHREALVDAATSGSTQFFLGTDSAPHARLTKEAACGCAGCYTAGEAMEMYAMAFDAAGALDKLEGFASLHGPAFYGLPVNDRKVVLRRANTIVPASYPYVNGDTLVPLEAGNILPWHFAGFAA
jgi:dihydroorotase